MLAKIIKIGNSQGLRIPKTLIEECNIQKTVAIKVHKNSLVITPCNEIRKDWDKKFNISTDLEDLSLSTFMNSSNSFDSEDWKW
jgi:antitoxin MazE